jgi:hypothetical protein
MRLPSNTKGVRPAAAPPHFTHSMADIRIGTTNQRTK